MFIFSFLAIGQFFHVFFPPEKPAVTGKQKSTSGAIPNGPTKSDTTWVHEIFQGTLTNETLCLNCETVSCQLIR